MKYDITELGQKQLTSDFFSFFDSRSLSAAAQVSRAWYGYAKAQQQFYLNKLAEQGIHLTGDYIPAELAKKHPIDPRELYFKLRYVPHNALFNSGTMCRLYPAYLMYYAMVGGAAYRTAAAYFLQQHPKNALGQDNFIGVHMSHLIAIGGDIENVKGMGEGALEFGLCNDPKMLLEGAILSGNWSLTHWVLQQNDYLKRCVTHAMRYAIEFMRSTILDNLAIHYPDEFNTLDCLSIALKSGHLAMVKRFLQPNQIPENYLHQAAELGHDQVFWWGVQNLKLSLSAKNQTGLIPLQLAIRHNHCKLVQQIVQVTKCLQDAEVFSLAVIEAVRSPECMRFFHLECGANLSITHPESGDSLVMMCLNETSLPLCDTSLCYLLLNADIDLNHKNHAGETYFDKAEKIAQNYRDKQAYAFCLRNLKTLVYLHKALADDADSPLFATKLLRLSEQQPNDPVIFLALAAIHIEDRSVSRDYLNRARDLAGKDYPKLVEWIQQYYHGVIKYAKNQKPVHILPHRQGCIIA